MNSQDPQSKAQLEDRIKELEEIVDIFHDAITCAGEALGFIDGYDLSTDQWNARAAYEVTREYCEAIGDLSQLPWDDAPGWQRMSALRVVHFYKAARHRGEDVTPAAAHDNWIDRKKRDGWTFGPVIDRDKKEHPCMVPYEDLPTEQKVKDCIFAAVIKNLFDLDGRS